MRGNESRQSCNDDGDGVQGKVREGLKVAAPRKMLGFRRHSAGLKIVREGNDRKQNHDQESQRNKLHRDAAAQRIICPAVLTQKPEAEEQERERQPQEIEKQFHRLSNCTRTRNAGKGRGRRTKGLTL